MQGRNGHGKQMSGMALESYTIALRPDVAKAVQTALPKRGTVEAALGAIVMPGIIGMLQ